MKHGTLPDDKLSWHISKMFLLSFKISQVSSWMSNEHVIRENIHGGCPRSFTFCRPYPGTSHQSAQGWACWNWYLILASLVFSFHFHFIGFLCLGFTFCLLSPKPATSPGRRHLTWNYIDDLFLFCHRGEFAEISIAGLFSLLTFTFTF